MLNFCFKKCDIRYMLKNNMIEKIGILFSMIIKWKQNKNKSSENNINVVMLIINLHDSKTISIVTIPKMIITKR